MTSSPLVGGELVCPMVMWCWFQEFVPENVISLTPFGPPKVGGLAPGKLSNLRQIASHLIVPYMVPAVAVLIDTLRKVIGKTS